MDVDVVFSVSGRDVFTGSEHEQVLDQLTWSIILVLDPDAGKMLRRG
jgi:hypothetical protein